MEAGCSDSSAGDEDVRPYVRRDLEELQIPGFARDDKLYDDSSTAPSP